MAADYTRRLFKDYESLTIRYEDLQDKHFLLRCEHRIAKRLTQQQEALIEKKERAEAQLKEENAALAKEVVRLRRMLDADGTNSGLPTSKTPLSKKKVIPNSRVKTGKKKGGQPGHGKKKLAAFTEKEVTETIIHKPETCPHCGGTSLAETGKIVSKDETDYEVVVVKRRHQFYECACTDCKKTYRLPVPTSLKEDNQYGEGVRALSLSLMNLGNVPINKTKKMIFGLSEEEINPSEGYLSKLQRRAAKDLAPFMAGLKKQCRKLPTLHWDDTVIDINTKRSCLRFYGDETLALYTAHRHKNKAGIDGDEILTHLPKETVVMHDHNKVNYNKDYSFQNIECNVHLLRDLQKVTDNLGRTWSKALKSHLNDTNAKRNEALARGEEAFDDEVIKAFFATFDQIMMDASSERQEGEERYWAPEERALLTRIYKYKDPYLAWVTNFDLPFSNNLSERSLRGVKSKMKISGQFQNEESAKHYATIKSYTETCHRHGINEMIALKRLCAGNPYTITEIFDQQSGE